MGSSLNKPELFKDGKRLDGRSPTELRKLRIEAGILKNANGSAYLELGNNRVMAAVFGPKEATPKHIADPTKAIIKCRYAMAPFSGLSDHGRTGPNRRSTEISKVAREVFENVIVLNDYPGGEIDIFMEILQSDGSTRAAGITAASVALANAGIHMKDLVYAASAGRIGEQLVVDVNMIEDNYSDADMPMVIAPRNNDVLLLQMDGGFSKEQFKDAVEMVLEAGKAIRKEQVSALERYYSNGKDKE